MAAFTLIMNPVQLLRNEVLGFLLLLSALLAYRALTGRLALTGLLSGRPGDPAVGAERVQLLLATLFVNAFYVRDVVHSHGTSLPDVNNLALVALGGSGGVYTVVKALRFRKFSNTNSKEIVP